MAKKRQRNEFIRPSLYDHEIEDGNGGKVGEIRVTPTAIMWKKKGAKGPTPYRGVTLEQFAKWVEDPTSGAKDRKQ